MLWPGLLGLPYKDKRVPAAQASPVWGAGSGYRGPPGPQSSFRTEAAYVARGSQALCEALGSSCSHGEVLGASQRPQAIATA